MADKIKFLTGKLADLKNKPKVQGQVYFAIDGETGKIAFDVDGQTRVFMDKASSADSATQDSAGNVISKYIKTIQLLSGDDTRFQYILGDGSYVPSKTTGIRLNFVSRAGDTMTGLLTAKGGILVNTATNTNNFIISRNGSATSECTTFGQNDQGLVIKNINDEATTSIRFDMEATDMESNAGAGANSGSITFGLSGGKTTVTADYFSGQASSAIKDTSGNTIASTFIKNLILNNHATQPYYQLVKGTGDNKSTVNLPVADAENAGVVTVGAQSFKGQKTFIYSDTTTAKKSSAIILNANGKSPTGIEFYRGDAADAASWQIVNHGGNFIFRTDYSDTVQTTYNVESLKLHYTTGAAQVPYLWVNPTSTQSGYRLYVNGNSYLNGKLTIADATTLASTLGFSGDYYTPNRMMWTNAGNVAQAAYHFVNSTQVAINSTSVPSANFYVNGTSGFNGNIDIWAGDEDRYLTFGYSTSTGYDWRIGYLGAGSGDANYLAFQSSKTDGKYVNALRLGLTTLDAAFGGNVYPLDGSAGDQCLGTSSSRWPYIYGAIGNFSSTVTATTFMASTENALSTSEAMRIKSGSTMYLNRGSSTSLIFQMNGTGHARFDTAGHFIPEATDTYNIGSSSKQWKNVYATTFNGVLKTNNIVLQNAAAAQYGRLYIVTEGTACATAGTAGTTGVAMLVLGNSTAVSSTAGEGANNARGRIRLYGTGANYIQLQAAPKTETNNYSFTLPPYEGNMYAAHTGSTDAVGSGVKPVYVGASGRITASSSTVGSGIKPIYLNAGTLTVSSSTVGSGIIPVFLNAGTLTASTSTIGSGIKPMFLNAGTLTASSSTVGSGVVPMFLSSGTLTASTSTVGSGIKPIYLNAGTLTVSSSTVGTSDRPVYLSSGTISQTTYRMAATNATATSGVDIGSTPQTGIWYVTGTTDILGYSDGVAIVNHYNSNWISQIYQDYRTGQIALRGKNNGTWQAWRTVIDTGNYTTHLDGRYVNSAGDTMTGALHLAYTTNEVMDYTSKNPQIVFSESGSQPVGIVYTDYDKYRSPAGLKVLDMSGSNGKVWFEVEGNVYASSFVGPLSGNASSASKVNNALTINGKSFNGSAAVDVGTIGTAYGGTGVTTHTANRLVWATSATTLQAGYHYANNTKVAINYTSEPSYNFYVNGTSFFSNAIDLSHNLVNIAFRRGTGYDTTISYQTSGNEALVAATKNAVTSFIFVNGEDTITNVAADRWTKITPALQIKNNSVYIGSLIANGTTPTYKFYVNGTSYFNGAVTTGKLTINTNAYTPFSTQPILYFINKSLSWASSYIHNVILLLPVLTASNQSVNNMFDGKFLLWKNGANIYDVIEVGMNCAYNQMKYYIKANGEYCSSWKLCVCTYGGVSYYALKVPYHANPYNQVEFCGHVRSDLTGGTGSVALPHVIAYYNENTQTVLNSEVNSSITETLTTTYVTSVVSTSSWFTGNLTTTGTITGSKVYNAIWNDYAEYFERGENTEAGDIVSLDLNSDEEKYIKATNGSVVCGIHSDSYGHLIGGKNLPESYTGSFEDYNNKYFIPVGMIGRVYCKVFGNIQKGDAIYASHIPGVGCIKTPDSKPQSFVGYACENYNSKEIGKIKILLRK